MYEIRLLVWKNEFEVKKKRKRKRSEDIYILILLDVKCIIVGVRKCKRLYIFMNVWIWEW